MGIIIEIAKFILNIIYSIYKIIFKEKNKISFFSRQSDTPSIDFILLKEELKRQNNDIEIVTLNKRIKKGVFGKIDYSFHMFKQMYHLSTSRVVILDGYQIIISILKQRDSLKVIQIWHALGSLKKFGYSVIDKKEGSKRNIIEKMNMHKNYDYILASSIIARKNFSEAFNTPESKFKIIGLPRVDFLTSEVYRKQTIETILKKYPMLNNGKKIILYVPTFRKNNDVYTEEIVNNVDYSKYNLIVKLHSGQEKIYVNNSTDLIKDNCFSGMEFIHIADYVITDYSAISYEAAIAKKPIYLYTYDYETYKENRDMYLNFEEEMPGVISKESKDILDAIYKNIIFESKREEFVRKYVSVISNKNTEDLAKFILSLI